MSEDATKQKINRAIRAAMKRLESPPGNGRIIRLYDEAFHIVAQREKENRWIRVVVGNVSPCEIEQIAQIRVSDRCTKEIWIKPDDGDFIIRHVV